MGDVLVVRPLTDVRFLVLLGGPRCRYFDTTKQGRIINKFSSDLSQVDGNLMTNGIDFLNSIFSAMLSTIVVLLVCPVVAIIMVPVVIGFYFVQRTYVAAVGFACTACLPACVLAAGQSSK